jgi:hypothetical protein
LFLNPQIRQYVSPYQVFILQAGDLPPEHCLDLRGKFMRHESSMAGGFLGGRREPIAALHAEFHRQLNSTLRCGLEPGTACACMDST